MLMVLLAIMAIFRVFFRNYISILAGLMVIAFTLVFTFALISVLYPMTGIHISMSLIIIAIALVDYLYFYYRWHVSQ